MATDRAEQSRRGQSPAKTTTKHPYAAIEHRVIDSPAYADLSFSARSLLQLLTRQLTRDNNGHLQATHSYMERFGFSDRTLTRAIRELISHGFVYRTRCGGYQQGASQYAVTWLKISRRDGLFLDGFLSCAWRYWEPEEKKSPPANLRAINRKNGDRTLVAQAKFTTVPDAKFTDNELMPCIALKAAHLRAWIRPPKMRARLMPSKVRRQLTANRAAENSPSSCKFSPTAARGQNIASSRTWKGSV